MISKSLSTSQRFARLTAVAGKMSEFCQSLYPLLTAHADDFGRLPGDPFTVKHVCHPTSRRSVNEMALALQHLDQVGLIRWYEVDGGAYIQILKFDEHQTGLTRRTKSRFPACLEGHTELPAVSVKPHAELNRTEQNSTQQKDQEIAPKEPAPVGKLFEEFSREHERKLQTKPVYAKGKDAALLAELWRQRRGQTPDAFELIRLFFASDDPFIRQGGYTVGFLKSQAGKLIAQSVVPQARAPDARPVGKGATNAQVFDEVYDALEARRGDRATVGQIRR